MAAPVVAGSVALLMQEDPTLTAPETLSLLQSTARADAFTGPVPNNTYGAGKLDTYTAMARLVNPGSTATLAIVAFDGAPTTTASVGTDGALALRFISPLADGGRLRGLSFQASSTGAGLNLTGPLAVQVWTHDGTGPGTQIGATNLVPAAVVQPFSWSYAGLSGTGVALAPGTMYWLILRPTSGTLALLAEGTTVSGTSFSLTETPSTARGNGDGESTAVAMAGPFAVTPLGSDLSVRPVLTSDASALPVELVSLSAIANGTEVRVAWTTAAESDNAGWHVEHRRLDGSPAAARWEDVGFVVGAGTTGETHSYEHRLMGLTPGRHAFRLRQLDLDGTATLSPTVEVTLGAERTLALHRLGANPFGQSTTLGLTVPATGAARVRLFDVLGREVAVLFSGDVEAGALVRVAVDGAALSPGVYVARAEQGGRAEALTLTLAR